MRRWGTVIACLCILLSGQGLARASTSIKCYNLQEGFKLALDNHVDFASDSYGGLPEVVVNRAFKKFIYSIENYSILANQGSNTPAYLVTQSEISVMNQEAAQANAVDVFRAMQRGDCSVTDKFTDVIKKQVQRLTDVFVNAAALASQIKQYNRSAAQRPNQRAWDFAQLKEFILDDLARGVYSSNEKSAQRVAEIFFKVLDQVRLDLEDLTEVQVLKSFASSLDPHSEFITGNENRRFTVLLAPTYSSAGIVMSLHSDGVHVDQVDDKRDANPADYLLGAVGLAQVAGPVAIDPEPGAVQKGDIILQIDGVPVDGKAQASIDRMIESSEKSEITLTLGQLIDGTVKNIHDVKRRLNKIRQDTRYLSSHLEIIEDPSHERSQYVDVIKLSEFYGTCAQDVANTIQEDKERFGRIDALVLDLRENYGGLVNDAVDLTGLFMPSGPVMATRGHQVKTGQKLNPDAKNYGMYLGPLVIAVSRNTASASEIIAGTLKDLKRALIVGEPVTFGKATAQEEFQFEQFGLFKITVDRIFTVGGESAQGIGIHSQIIVPRAATAADMLMAYMGPPAPAGELNEEFTLPGDHLEKAFGTPAEIESSADPDLDAPLLEQLEAGSFHRVKSMAAKSLRKASAEGTSADLQLDEIVQVAAQYSYLKKKKHSL